MSLVSAGSAGHPVSRVAPERSAATTLQEGVERAVKLPKTPGKTTPAFAFSIVRRAIIEGIADRQFGESEMQEVIAFFGGSWTCVFCGSEPFKRWDHLVAISEGGDTVLGNMVPVCARCDDSKGASPYREWALGDAKYSPKAQGVPDIEDRLDEIDKYVAKYDYHPQPPKDRLNSEEFQEFKRLQADCRRLRKDFNTFFVQYRERIGSG